MACKDIASNARLNITALEKQTMLSTTTHSVKHGAKQIWKGRAKLGVRGKKRILSETAPMLGRGIQPIRKNQKQIAEREISGIRSEVKRFVQYAPKHEVAE